MKSKGEEIEKNIDGGKKNKMEEGDDMTLRRGSKFCVMF